MVQGNFSQQLKRAFVIPIPNVSPPGSIEDDLRPISLTSQISKVMEGFTLDSLLGEVSSKLGTKPFALRRKSTTQALVYLLHLIHAGLDVGHCYARLFFADFRKDFDLIDHNFIGELRNLQVHPAVIKWIKSFLAGREQTKCKTRNGIFFLEESERWPTSGH